MKINVSAKPGSKKGYIKQINNTQFVVAVKEQAIEGKANQAIIKSLAKYFNTPISSISIVSGKYNREKIIEIKDFKQLQFWQEQET